MKEKISVLCAVGSRIMMLCAVILYTMSQTAPHLADVKLLMFSQASALVYALLFIISELLRE